MSSSVNQVTLVGRLGKDPEIRFTGTGKAVCNMSIATDEQWNDAQSGERQKRTEWHKVQIWDKAAENCAKYLSKGSLVYVRGSIRTRKYEAKDGSDRYVTEIRAWEVVFLSSKSDGDRPSRSERAAERDADREMGDERPNFTDDDIPFR